MKELCSVEPDKPDNRFNDAKCDRMGRLWVGTMGKIKVPGVLPEKQGNFYSYDGGMQHSSYATIKIFVIIYNTILIYIKNTHHHNFVFSISRFHS